MEKEIKVCEQCINCMYIENGDMVCDLNDELVYENFQPSKKYMWCNLEKYEGKG